MSEDEKATTATAEPRFAPELQALLDNNPSWYSSTSPMEAQINLEDMGYGVAVIQDPPRSSIYQMRDTMSKKGATQGEIEAAQFKAFVAEIRGDSTLETAKKMKPCPVEGKADAVWGEWARSLPSKVADRMQKGIFIFQNDMGDEQGNA